MLDISRTEDSNMAAKDNAPYVKRYRDKLKATKGKQVIAYLDHETATMLDELAAKDGRFKSDIIKEAIRLLHREGLDPK